MPQKQRQYTEPVTEETGGDVLTVASAVKNGWWVRENVLSSVHKKL